MTKSVLVEAASHINHNPFWCLKMKAYLEDLPAHLASEGAIAEAFSELESIDELSEEAFKKTLDLLNKLPEWREVLRAPNLKDLQDKVQLKLTELTETVLANGKSAWYTLLQQALAEACIVFPLSKDLNDLQSKVASNIAFEEQRLVSSMVQDLFLAMLEVRKPEELWPKLKECVVEMQKMKVGGLEVPPAMLQQVVLHVMGLVHGFVVETPTGEGAFPVVSWFSALAKITSVPSYEALAACLQSALDLVVAKGEGKVELTSMQVQRSKLHSLESHMTELQPMLEEGEVGSLWLKPLQTVKGATEVFIKEKGVLMQTEAETELQTCIGEAQALLEKVQKWKQASAAKTMSTVMNLAKDSILSVDPGNFDTAQTKLKQADTCKETMLIVGELLLALKTESPIL